MAAKFIRRLERTTLRLSILYFLVALVLFGCADRLVLFPTTHRAMCAADRFDIPGPAGRIEIWKKRSPGAADREPAAFVMTFVGNASRAEYDVDAIAKLWGDKAVEVWAVNYPGYGGSEGKARLASIAPATLAAYDAMKAQAHDRPTFVGGRSIGTTAALHVAAHRPVSGVFLHSPPPLRSLILGQFGWWNLWLGAIPVALAVPSDLDSVANGAKTKAPAVFLITGGDRFVPPAYQRKVLNAYAGAIHIVLMPDTDHNDPIPDDEMAAVHRSLDWLLQQGKQLAAAPGERVK